MVHYSFKRDEGLEVENIIYNLNRQLVHNYKNDEIAN